MSQGEEFTHSEQAVWRSNNSLYGAGSNQNQHRLHYSNLSLLEFDVSLLTLNTAGSHAARRRQKEMCALCKQMGG